MAGWLKRGPSGIIGTNIPDAKETASCILEDHAKGLHPCRPTATGGAGLLALLQERGVNAVPWNGWVRIDEHEVATGEANAKLREKLVDPSEMLRVAAGNPT